MKTNTKKILTCLTALTMALPQFPALHANAEPLPQKSPEPVSAPAPAVTEYPAATTYGNMGTDHCCTTGCWETTSCTMSRTDISDWEKLFGTTTTTYVTWRTDQCSDLSYLLTAFDYGSTNTQTTTTTTTTEVHDHTPHHGVGAADILPVKKVFQIGEELDFSDAGAFVCGHIEDAYGEHIIYWDNFTAYPLSHYDYDMDASAFDNTKPGKYTILFTLHMSGGEFGVPDFDIHTSCEVEVTDSVVTTGNDSVLTTTTVTTTTSQNRMYFAPNTGDVNGDKTLDVRDAVLLARIVGGDTTANAADNSQADINRNQQVDTIDLMILLRRLAHLI